MRKGITTTIGVTLLYVLTLTFGMESAAQEVSSVVELESVPETEASLLVADFNKGRKPNQLRGEFGSWNYAPNDETQGCWDWFEPEDFAGGDGYSVSLEYDVLSPNPAFCGFWMKLQGTNISAYDTLSFWVRGDNQMGFTTRFKVELKNKAGKRAVYTISGVTNEWQEFRVPFKGTRAIQDWSKLDEFTVVFDDILVTKKTGKIFMDNISFQKSNPEEITPVQASL